jgi:hypothetical protein
MSDAEAEQRLASQRPFEQRAPGADWTCMNDGSLEQLEAAVDAELTRIRELRIAGELSASVFEPWWKEFIEKNRAAIEASVAKPADRA